MGGMDMPRSENAHPGDVIIPERIPDKSVKSGGKKPEQSHRLIPLHPEQEMALEHVSARIDNLLRLDKDGSNKYIEQCVQAIIANKTDKTSAEGLSAMQIPIIDIMLALPAKFIRENEAEVQRFIEQKFYLVMRRIYEYPKRSAIEQRTGVTISSEDLANRKGHINSPDEYARGIFSVVDFIKHDLQTEIPPGYRRNYYVNPALDVRYKIDLVAILTPEGPKRGVEMEFIQIKAGSYLSSGEERTAVDGHRVFYGKVMETEQGYNTRNRERLLFKTREKLEEFQEKLRGISQYTQDKYLEYFDVLDAAKNEGQRNFARVRFVDGLNDHIVRELCGGILADPNALCDLSADEIRWFQTEANLTSEVVKLIREIAKELTPELVPDFDDILRIIEQTRKAMAARIPHLPIATSKNEAPRPIVKCRSVIATRNPKNTGARFLRHEEELDENPITGQNTASSHGAQKKIILEPRDKKEH